MKNTALLFSCVTVTLFCFTSPAWAGSNTGSFSINGNSSTTQNLTANGETGVVTSTGTLDITSSNNVAITVTANATITNAGTIEQNDGGRAIRSTGTGDVLTITNTAGALITATGSDAIQMKATGSVTINNYGTISTTGTDLPGTGGLGDQALNLNILNSNGTTTAYTNIVNNYAGGTISAFESDALRPGASGTINNSGTIKSTNASDNTSSSDGIDAQVNNTGVTINNGSSTTVVAGVTSANLIEGARHGITGGQQTDTAATPGSSLGNSSGVYDLPFTMTINNAANSTIKGDDGSGVNIDGVDGTEQVTIVNAGTITGNGVTGDGDGVDVDGVVNITNTGTIRSLNALNDTSEGVTVGGGTITNSGTIEGSVSSPAGNTAVGRGITLAGIDHTETNGTDTDIPIEKIYTTTTVINSGLIKGDSDSGIAILGITGTTNFSVTITNTLGGTIEGGGAVAAIDGSALAGGVGTASSNNETVINFGTIKADGTGKAISLGMGNNSVQIMGGSASVIGDMSGATLTGTNTAALTIDPSSGQSFNYGGVISNFTSVEIKSGTVTLFGANTYTGTTTIDGAATLDLTGTGTIGNTTMLTIASGGIFDLGGNSVTVGSLQNSGTINNGMVNTSGTGTISGLSGSTGFNKMSSGTTTITGTNTYTGGTTVSNGRLAIDGSVTGNVAVQHGAEVGGHGSIGGTISGSGAVGPGNSPGILTASSTDPSGGLTYNLEFTQGGAATWSNASASGNDVLHLTATLAFTAPLTSANNINVYFSQAGLTFEGGFFTDGATDNLTANIANATYNYYLLDNTNGTVSYNGNEYDLITGVTGTTTQITGANFATGTVNGYTEQFTVASAPEPSTYVLLGLGLIGLLIAGRRRGATPRSHQ